MIMPLIQPSTAPAPTPMSAESQMDRCRPCHSSAMTMAPRPATEPTERSMPPVRMTTLRPSATSPNGMKFWVRPSSEPMPS